MMAKIQRQIPLAVCLGTGWSPHLAVYRSVLLAADQRQPDMDVLLLTSSHHCPPHMSLDSLISIREIGV